MADAAKIKLLRQDRRFYFCVNVVLTLLVITIIYPIILVISSSFSAPSAVYAGRVFLWPVDLSVEGYKAVFKNRQIVSGALNSVFYTGVGTLVNLVMTTLAAYPLARRTLPGRSIIMKLFVFTMFFSGGMIPSFLIVKMLGLYNSRAAIILPTLISTWNMIIMKTALQAVPDALEESARLDGANDLVVLFQILVPIVKATIAVIALYYIVGEWNSWFNAMIYLRDNSKRPLQLFLREILIVATFNQENASNADAITMAEQLRIASIIKYATMIVATLPVIAAYPFIQRYFVKGVMIGAVKG